MSLIKQIGKSTVIRQAVASFIAFYVRLVWVTSRWEFVGKEYPDPYWHQHKPMIGCFWHGRMLMMFKTWLSPDKFHMLNSIHADGDILSRTTRSFGFGSIRGSSSGGGARALITIIKTLKMGEAIGITPEGQRGGPCYCVSIGVIKIARLSGVPILPVSYSSTRGIFRKSWDKFFIPFPFGKGVFMYGPLLEVAGSSRNDEELRQDLENTLITLTKKADLYCNREPHESP